RGQLLAVEATRRLIPFGGRRDRDRVAGGERVGGGVIDSAGAGGRLLLLAGEEAEHGGGRVAEFDAVLRSFRPGDRRGDSGQIQLDDLTVFGGLFGVVPESLLLGVGLDEVDLLRRAAGQSQVLHRLLVDGEDGARGAVFGTHIAQGGAVGQGDVRHAGAEELDEFADDPRLPQQLGYGEDEVCGR